MSVLQQSPLAITPSTKFFFFGLFFSLAIFLLTRVLRIENFGYGAFVGILDDVEEENRCCQEMIFFLLLFSKEKKKS